MQCIIYILQPDIKCIVQWQISLKKSLDTEKVDFGSKYLMKNIENTANTEQQQNKIKMYTLTLK